MRPARKLACAVLALAVVTSVVYATGAFTSTTAERDVNVNVAGDGSAFLALQPSEGPNGDFASYGPMGALQVKIGGASSSSSGVNPDSLTQFRNVFVITNKGTQPVRVWFTGGSEAVTFRAESDGESIEGKSGAVILRPGRRSVHVGFVIDSRSVKPGTDLLESVRIHADPQTEDAASLKSLNNGNTGGNGGGGSGSGNGGNQASGGGSGGGNGGAQAGGGSQGWPGDDEDGEDSSNSNTDEGSIDQSDRDENANCGDDLICQLRNDVDNVIGFLQEHPALLGVLSPGMGIAAWAYENPEQALSLVLGALLGATGMPEGELSVPEAGSLAYFAGWMAVSFAPGIDIAADARDTIQAAINLKPWETLLGLVAIVPGAGKVGDLGQIAKYTADWLGAFDKAADLRRWVTSGLMSGLPDGVKRVIIGETMPAVVQRSSLSQDEWARMVNNGHDAKTINRLLDSGFDGDDIRRFTSEGVDLKQVKRLRGEGVSAYDVRHYVDEGTNLNRVENLAEDGMPAEDIRHYVDNGDDAYNTRFQASMTVGGRRIQLGDGMSLRQVERLQTQGFSPEDIRFYVKNGVSLKLVSSLERIPRVSPDNVRTAIEAFGASQTIAGGAGMYGDIREWCELNGTSSPICS